MNNSEELKKKKKDSVYLIIAGVLFFIVGAIFYIVFAALEKGELHTASVPVMIYYLYQVLGKFGIVLISILGGIICFITGFLRYSKIKKQMS